MSDAVMTSLEALAVSTEAFQHSIAGLTDDRARAASLLPGWTRGHVLTHVARNADAMVNLVRSARTHQHIPMYPSRAQRDADITRGAGRSAGQLVGDVQKSHERLMAELAGMDSVDWSAAIRYGADDREGNATLIPPLRRSEVEIHHVDLDLGYTLAHWPPDFVEPMLERVAGDFSTRADAPSLTLVGNDERRWHIRDGGQEVSGPASALLGWLVGRTDGSGLTTEGKLPTLGAWR